LQKTLKSLIIKGSRSFKVIDVGTIQKLVTMLRSKKTSRTF